MQANISMSLYVLCVYICMCVDVFCWHMSQTSSLRLISGVYSAFLRTAVMYAKIIVSERFLDHHVKTVRATWLIWRFLPGYVSMRTNVALDCQQPGETDQCRRCCRRRQICCRRCARLGFP